MKTKMKDPFLVALRTDPQVSFDEHSRLFRKIEEEMGLRSMDPACGFLLVKHQHYGLWDGIPTNRWWIVNGAKNAGKTAKKAPKKG
jgi:hypothetical protein